MSTSKKAPPTPTLLQHTTNLHLDLHWPALRLNMPQSALQQGRLQRWGSIPLTWSAS